eukprot:scaffold20429_cov102-Isochrysis_galbana.AAC.1
MAEPGAPTSSAPSPPAPRPPSSELPSPPGEENGRRPALSFKDCTPAPCCAPAACAQRAAASLDTSPDGRSAARSMDTHTGACTVPDPAPEGGRSPVVSGGVAAGAAFTPPADTKYTTRPAWFSASSHSARG